MLTRIRTALPTHPTTHVQALGFSRTGEPIWPIRGGADDDADSGDDDDDKDDDDDDKDDDADSGDDDDKDDDADSGDDDKPLGPKGEKAYQAEKDKRRAAQARLREWRALGLSPAEVKKRLEGLPDAKDGKQPDADAIREQIRAEVDGERQRERVLDKIEAKAARGFADPDDAAALLLRSADVNDFLDEDGKIDVEAIEDGLKDLLEKKPYLAAQGGKRFKGGADGGARKEQQPKAKSLQDAVAARIAAGKKT